MAVNPGLVEGYFLSPEGKNVARSDDIPAQRQSQDSDSDFYYLC